MAGLSDEKVLTDYPANTLPKIPLKYFGSYVQNLRASANPLPGPAVFMTFIDNRQKNAIFSAIYPAFA
jgi:hypothetical protein